MVVVLLGLWIIGITIAFILMDATFSAKSWWSLLHGVIVIGLVFVHPPVAAFRAAGITSPASLLLVGLTGMGVVVLLFFIARWTGLTSALSKWFDRNEPANDDEA